MNFSTQPGDMNPGESLWIHDQQWRKLTGFLRGPQAKHFGEEAVFDWKTGLPCPPGFEKSFVAKDDYVSLANTLVMRGLPRPLYSHMGVEKEEDSDALEHATYNLDLIR